VNTDGTLTCEVVSTSHDDENIMSQVGSMVFSTVIDGRYILEFQSVSPSVCRPALVQGSCCQVVSADGKASVVVLGQHTSATSYACQMALGAADGTEGPVLDPQIHVLQPTLINRKDSRNPAPTTKLIDENPSAKETNSSASTTVADDVNAAIGPKKKKVTAQRTSPVNEPSHTPAGVDAGFVPGDEVRACC